MREERDAGTRRAEDAGRGQETIASTPLTRAAALAGAGARVGVNYLKHYGRAAVGGRVDTEALHADNAADVYRAFSELKGGPLKVAQMLSIDRNLLPAAYADQFAQAQYSAPPLSYPLVARTFRREFGRGPEEIFERFSREAAHGASIGQVHRAARDGREFAVKVQYPGVAESLRSDLALVKPIALRIMGVREADVADYFREVEERLLEETDYALELERSVALSAASARVAGVRFPRYYPEWSSRRILTMDWIDGVTLDRFADGPAGQEERDRVGQALWDFYEHQVHGLRQFHADPHPGNFLVREGELWVIDFGCTKQLDAEFYARQFAFLDPTLIDEPARLEAALEAMGILLPGDGPEERRRLRELCARSLELLARPFRGGEFDFGDPEFMARIYEMGLENRNNDLLRSMRGRRGSPHSLYVNRTYFGLYSLLARLRARVRINLPAVAVAGSRTTAVAGA